VPHPQLWPSGAVYCLDLNSGAGTYDVTFTVTDAAGNVSPPQTNTIEVYGPIKMPEITASVIVVNCNDPTNQTGNHPWVTNTSGLIYWSVGQPLCVIPGASLRTGTGTDVTDPANPLHPLLGGETSYRLLAPTVDLTGLTGAYLAVMQKITQTLPTSDDSFPADVTDPLMLTVTNLTVTTETKKTNDATSDATSIAAIVVYYQAKYQLGWYAGNGSVGSSAGPTMLTPVLSFRIIALNLGVTP